MVDTPAVVGDRRVMAKRSPHSFKKRQKELKRKRKAEEKMARRHGKKKQEDVFGAPAAAGWGWPKEQKPEEQKEEEQKEEKAE